MGPHFADVRKLRLRKINITQKVWTELQLELRTPKPVLFLSLSYMQG